jgi:hypothetical protein
MKCRQLECKSGQILKSLKNEKPKLRNTIQFIVKIAFLNQQFNLDNSMLLFSHPKFRKANFTPKLFKNAHSFYRHWWGCDAQPCSFIAGKRLQG